MEVEAKQEEFKTGPELEPESEPEQNLRVKEVYGSVENIKKIGSPIDLSGGGTHIRYYFLSNLALTALAIAGLSFTLLFVNNGFRLCSGNRN